MDRRTFLVAAVSMSGLAGCARLSGRFVNTPTLTPTSTSVSEPTLAEQGFPSDICEQEVVDGGIYAISEPAFADDWSSVKVADRYAADGRLADDAAVIGVVQSIARAYPLSILWHHEIVNDCVPTRDATPQGADDDTDRNGIPLLVTYCPICRSGMVAERRVAGKSTIFGVSGQLWQPPSLYTRASEARNRTFAAELGNTSDDLRVRNSGNLLMIDEATESFWSQLLAQAICGPRRGDSLPLVPSTVTTWSKWRDSHPDTEVLLPPPHSTFRER